MAQSFLRGTRLRLVFETGTDGNGNPILKAKSFSNVIPESTVDQLSQAAQAISGLCSDTLSKVERNDSSEILG